MSTKHRVDVWTFKCEYGFDKIVSWLQDNYFKFMLTWLIPKNNNIVDTVVDINVVNETLNILNNNTDTHEHLMVVGVFTECINNLTKLCSVDNFHYSQFAI